MPARVRCRRSSCRTGTAGSAARPRRRGVHGVTRSSPTICFWTARPRSTRVSGVVVDCPRAEARCRLGEDLVGGVEGVEDLGHADVGDRLVDDLFDLDRRDADGERGSEHHPVLVSAWQAIMRGELHHEPGAGVEVGVLEHFVEGEVVEDLDQFGVGDRQGRDVAGEQLVVVLLRGIADRHGFTSFAVVGLDQATTGGSAGGGPGCRDTGRTPFTGRPRFSTSS